MPIGYKAIELPKSLMSDFSMSDIASTISSEANKKTTPKLEAYLENRPVEEKIKEILSSPYPISISLGIRLTFIQQLEYGFNQFYEAIKPTGEEFTRLDEIDEELQEHFQAKYMIGLAKMLMHCKQFAELDFEDKINIPNSVANPLYSVKNDLSD
uniref:Uncharacterized protein n=1 Tax=Acrobeloides nanus TaxID=290746 RepID=A0A914EKS2_9BILA